MAEYSKRLRAEAASLGIPTQSLVMAYLMACGFTDNEAYEIAYSCNASFSKSKNVTIRQNIIEGTGFPEMVIRIKQKLAGGALSPTSATASNMAGGQLSKDDIANILRKQIDALPDGDKAKTDAAIKYAELFAMKKEETKDEREEDIIRAWLPLPCYDCPYKTAYDNAHKEKKDNNT